MIKFVNAKINIGLQIVKRREDGYHDLQTIFYPVGMIAGTERNPTSFCDVLELVGREEGNKKIRIADSAPESLMPEIILTGRKMNCELKQNLIYKAALSFCRETGADFSNHRLILDKNLPDGAGMGGGSADASFTLRMLADKFNDSVPDRTITTGSLLKMASGLGADCPFFILNRPAYAEGIGERLEEVPLDLSQYVILIVKPKVYVSTKDAFAGVKPTPGDIDLRRLPQIPIEEWRGIVKNDFEDSIFPKFPLLEEVKLSLYNYGALYASLTGSGSALYGFFNTDKDAERAKRELSAASTIEAVYLLK